MHFTSKIIYFLIVFRYVASKSEVEFIFNAISLGHSGLLITWKPNVETESEKTKISFPTFEFNVYPVEEKNETFKFDKHRCEDIVGEDSEFNVTTFECHGSEGQFKIHSLNENKLYEIVIGQYIIGYTSQTSRRRLCKRKYRGRMRTRTKSGKIPAKPDFEYEHTSRKIRWYPCGRERICPDDQESGTHFGITITEPYNTRQWIEVETEEFYLDHRMIILWPGRIYEIVVFSINGAYKTDSDIQEIFLEPASTMVQYVNVISLPDSSVLISWKPPKYSLDLMVQEGSESHNEYLVSLPSYNVPEANNEAPIWITDWKDIFSKYFDKTREEQTRYEGLKFGLTYNFMIIPYKMNFPFGFEYRVKFKLHAYDDALPIASPDFNYKLEKSFGRCYFNFFWLPCGQSFNCENTRPGANYSFEISPKFGYSPPTPKSGHYSSTLDMGTEYQVRLRSSIGKNYSEPAIKYFKDCEEIKRNPSEKTNEL